MHSLSLIYGPQVFDDLEFCRQNEEVILRYEHGILTLQPAPMKTLKSIAADPTSVPGWREDLQSHPEHCAVLQEFFRRLIRAYEYDESVGRIER
jgi:hypothetical protein